VAELQKKYLLEWVGVTNGTFLELDAGDGVTGSHAVWLEEVGWKGVSLEARPVAAQLLKKNRPASYQPFSSSESISRKKVDLVSARRENTIKELVDGLANGDRPPRVILQARDPQAGIFRIMNRAGYRLDHFIHDDEYYRLESI
jgi:hypothetical protein